MLSVRNGARALDFYKAAFGAVELFRIDNEKGENQHGWRVGRVVDPFGHHWEIGKPLSKDR
jgi:uncharacterized glyoxalase superfamily protein PhnB